MAHARDEGSREIILYDDDALQLMPNWWNGQSDPLYAIHSMGGAHDERVFEDAIDNLDHELGRVKKLGPNKFQLGKGTFTKKEINELHIIRDALAAAIESETGRVLEERPVRERTVRAPAFDGDYCVQQLYRDGSFVGGGPSEEWYDDEREAVGKAKRIAGSSSFEGDYTRVITRDGEAVWSSRDPGRRAGEVRSGSRMYNVVVINERTGKKEYLNSSPMTHHEAVTFKKKQRPHRDTRFQLEPAENAFMHPDAPGFRGATVRDYEVIDGRTDRRRAGPFKHRHEADDAKGPGDVVRFVPGHRASEPQERNDNTARIVAKINDGTYKVTSVQIRDGNAVVRFTTNVGPGQTRGRADSAHMRAVIAAARKQGAPMSRTLDANRRSSHKAPEPKPRRASAKKKSRK